MFTLEKLKIFKNNTKEKLRQMKNNSKEKLKTFKNNSKEKLIKFKNNTIEKLRKIKIYAQEKYKKNMFTIQFILSLVLIFLLICSLIMNHKLSMQLDNLLYQIDYLQELAESDIDVDSTPVPDSTEDSSSTTTSDTSDTSTTSDTTETTETTDITSIPSSSTTSSDVTAEPSLTVTTNTETDLDLLACVIYQEAGGNGSCDECRRRVADIVLNRVDDPRFPNTIREVLTARNQYGKFYYTGVKWPSRSKRAIEQDAVARAYRIAAEVLNGQHSDLYGNGYVWQAAFRQGTGQIYCCGEYFGK